jgi:hypothetical protein
MRQPLYGLGGGGKDDRLLVLIALRSSQHGKMRWPGRRQVLTTELERWTPAAFQDAAVIRIAELRKHGFGKPRDAEGHVRRSEKAA